MTEQEIDQALQLAAEIQKETARVDAERSLYEFVKMAWEVREPNTKFIPGWHLEAICEHLEAVTNGRIRDLLITVPPGSTKSLTVCVFWPAWVWIKNPSTRWLFASYSMGLVERDAGYCKQLMAGEWYQANWGHCWRFQGTASVTYQNDKTGARRGTSPDSGATGWKGDVLVIDDPHNVKEAESDVIRASTIEWYDHAFYNRSNDLRTGPHVIIGQRTHHEDLIGHLLKQGGYEHLNIPEEFEADQKCTTVIGWTDPRTREGELMRPERFGPAEVKAARTRLQEYGYAAQHQQRPSPRKGGMFQREWFKIKQAAPAGMRKVRYWDKAFTSEEGCFTAGVLMGATEDGFYWVLGVVRGQWSSHNRNQVMLQTAQMDKVETKVMVEREPAAGKESAEYSVKLLAGFSVGIDLPVSNKEVRAQPFAAQCEAGNVFLLAGDWNEAYIDEHCRFPKSSIKDQVDASSGAFNWLVLHNTWGPFGGSNPREAEFARIPGGDPTLGRLERGWGGDFGGGE